APGVIGHKVVPGPVKRRTKVLVGNGEANGVRDTLAQRSRGHFDTLVLDLRVTRAQSVHAVRVVRLELLESHSLVPGEMEERVLKETSVSVGENKSITVEVIRGVWCIAHHVSPEGDADGRHADSTPASISASIFDHR